MSKSELNNNNTQQTEEVIALDDERRVKVLSPSMLVFKRFIRNKLAIVGTVFIVAMFIFSFIGGLISPYGEAEVFRHYEEMYKDYAAAKYNETYYFTEDANHKVPNPSVFNFKFMGAKTSGKTEFTVDEDKFTIEELGEKTYAIYSSTGDLVTVASTYFFDTAVEDFDVTLDFRFAAQKAIADKEESFTVGGKKYFVKTNEEGNNIICNADSKELVFISDYIVNSAYNDIKLSFEEKSAIKEAIESGAETYEFDGNTFKIEKGMYETKIKGITKAYVNLSYASPSKEHWLGTDANGMDILTRLMYGGRVSLMIGFIVVIVETVLGVILGGISGYFGGVVDNLIMRIVDIFNCIPSTPLIIILGAMMDAMQIDPQIRMIYLMLILGFLGWPGVARLVRGQILSLREQEFMTATEATGISVSRRIFKHLVPNVIPQLIVICTMGLGGVILTESTLSFLGLGVKFPFASWGNIINAVSNVFVMTNYWFVWIPAGFCILITVLGFNFIGDGLRDAFDPKMKR